MTAIQDSTFPDPTCFTFAEGAGGQAIMDPLFHDEPDQHCPHCGAWQPGGDDAAACPFCRGELPWSNRHHGQNTVFRGLMWVAGAYRLWSLIVFVSAVIDLLWVANAKSFFFGFLVLYPFAMASGLRTGCATQRPAGSLPF